MRLGKTILSRAGFLLVTLAFVGCKHPYVGTYVKENLPEQQIVLKENHSFSLIEAQKFEGKYQVKGQNITLTTDTGLTTTGKMYTNVLIDAHGGKWVKQPGSNP